MRKLWLIGCAVLLLAALAQAKKGNTDEEAIRKLDAEWSAAAGNKDVDKSVSVYAEDAVFLPNKAPIATGRA